MDKLTSNIIDVIKEEQVKLGYRKERIRLYYPLSSLNILMGTRLSSEQMKSSLTKFFAEKTDIFGDVEVTFVSERFCINLPEQTSEYVHTHTEQTGFLYEFIDLIGRHDITIEEVIQQFNKFSQSVHFERMSNMDFDYLVYFENGEPDSYRYCLTLEGHHMIYHRYTKEDYEELFK